MFDLYVFLLQYVKKNFITRIRINVDSVFTTNDLQTQALNWKTS